MPNELAEVLSSIAESVEFLGIDLKDVNQRGIFGNTPLKVASVRGDADAVRVLLAAGAEVNDVVEDGFTALHHAAAQGNLEVVSLLLEHGASTDMRDDDGRTPAELARVLKETEAARIIEAAEASRGI